MKACHSGNSRPARLNSARRNGLAFFSAAMPDLECKAKKRKGLALTGYPEVETYGRGGAAMILPSQTEAGSGRTQPCRGIPWWADRRR